MSLATMLELLLVIVYLFKQIVFTKRCLDNLNAS